MKKKRFILFFIFLLSSTVLFAQDFITQWAFSSSATTISFDALTVAAVSYTWSAAPSGNNGSGSFTQATAGSVTLTGLTIDAGDTVTLSMAPANLRRFYINNGADRLKLIDVAQWGAVPWTSMQYAFYGCEYLDITATDTPDLNNVTNCVAMFCNCTMLNNPSNINSWNTGNVTNMGSLFSDATHFNQPIGNWDTHNVTSMGHMFHRAVTFNQDIGNWNTINVTDMYGMFRSAIDFDQDIGNWNTQNVTDMREMFFMANSFNHNIGSWNTQNVTDMHEMFHLARVFNQPIGNWNTQNVTDMSWMFRDASAFNQPIGTWDTHNVTNMSYMFACTSYYTSIFNQPIGNWNTQNVTLMTGMFDHASYFNQPIGSWNTQNVTDMYKMFHYAESFNQPIGNWNTQNVTDMSWMFIYASAFNQPIGTWDTHNVSSMYEMFCGATAFDQPLSSWDVQSSVNMSFMFCDASAFNQDLGAWTFNSQVYLGAFLQDAGMDCTNYSFTLIGWKQNNSTLTDRYLGAVNLEYSDYAQDARNFLVDTLGWTMWGDSPAGDNCFREGDFVTEWNFLVYSWNINFYGLTDGDVAYQWYSLPSGTFGSGSFNKATAGYIALSGMSFDAGEEVILMMSPENLRRFYIDYGEQRLYLTDVVQWGDVPWMSMENAFFGCENLEITAADDPDLSNVSDMSLMFAYASSFNNNINDWNTQNVTDMSWLFAYATGFDQPLANWNTQNVANMSSMFEGSSDFNQPVGNWNTQQVNDMSFMFAYTGYFNQPIGSWNTENVSDMSRMFAGAQAFNQPVGTWNTTNAEDMKGMFAGTAAFDQPLANWNTENVTDMSEMFSGALVFDQPLGNWNTQNVTDMGWMFEYAPLFDQNLGNWDIGSVTAMNNMLNDCGMSEENYDNTLLGWADDNGGSQIIPSSISLGASGLDYCDAYDAHYALTSTYGWTITGDNFACPNQWVVNKNDAGAGSLRNAITYSQANSDIHFASFMSNKVIKLEAGALVFDHNVNIISSLSENITVNASSVGYDFFVPTGIQANVEGLKFKCGNADDVSCVNNHGILLLKDCQFDALLSEPGAVSVQNYGTLTIEGEVDVFE